MHSSVTFSIISAPSDFKTPEMCIKAVCMTPYTLRSVPDPFKTQETCNEAVVHNPYRCWRMSQGTFRPRRCVRGSAHGAMLFSICL